MPAKRPRRFRFIGNKIMTNRTAAIALIVVCIVGTAILITARSSEPTSAAAVAPPQTAEAVFQKIAGFAAFGFPKAHATAFGLLAYQSAWLRMYYGPEFLCALFNAQPMGFYAPHVLIVNTTDRDPITGTVPVLSGGGIPAWKSWNLRSVSA